MVSSNAPSSDIPYSAFQSQDSVESISALKALKNELIGHPERKREAITSGIIPSLLNVLQSQTSSDETKVQAAIILASLSQPDVVSSKREPDSDKGQVLCHEERQVVSVLLHCIAAQESSAALVLPCLRALSFMAASGADTSAIWHNYLPSLANVLQAAVASNKLVTIQQATYVASLLASYTEHVRLETASADVALEGLISLAVVITQLGCRTVEASTPLAKLLEATLAALAAMTKLNLSWATQLASAGRLSEHRCASDDAPMITTLLKLIKHQSNLVRLGSASCLTNMFKHGLVPKRHYKDLALCVVPILVRSFDDDALRCRAASVLTDLVKDSDDMQRAACDAGAVKKLSNILQLRPDSYSESTLENALLALAAITLQKDEYRKLVIDAKAVPLIVTAMSHPSARVRASACQCVRSLSRSVAMLRTSLIDAGVATAVFQLMTDSNMNVKTSATAAICNLVLDFSPMRRMILEAGILVLLVKLCRDENAELRLNAVWAIKHIVYAADTDVKESVLAELSPALLLRLCDDPEVDIQEQACEVIRNLVCGKPENIDLLIENIGIERLAEFLMRKLDSDRSQLVVSGVYSLVHIAAGSERHRAIIMQRSNILEALHKHLGSDVEDVRLGAIWTIINLTYQEDETTATGREARINALESLGFLSKLQEMEGDPSRDARERVKTAIAQMQ